MLLVLGLLKRLFEQSFADSLLDAHVLLVELDLSDLDDIVGVVKLVVGVGDRDAETDVLRVGVWDDESLLAVMLAKFNLISAQLHEIVSEKVVFSVLYLEIEDCDLGPGVLLREGEFRGHDSVLISIVFHNDRRLV